MDNLNRPQIEHLSDREVLLLTAQKVLSVEEHLAKMNGRVGKHEDKLNELDKWRSSVDGSLKAWKLILGSGGLFAVIAFIFETVYH